MDNRNIIDCASWQSFPCWWATQPSHCQPLQAPLLLGPLLLSNTGSLPQSLARLIRFLSWEKTRRLKRSASLRWIPEIDVLFASARSIFLFSITSFGFVKELLRRMKCFFSGHLFSPKYCRGQNGGVFCETGEGWGSQNRTKLLRYKGSVILPRRSNLTFMGMFSWIQMLQRYLSTSVRAGLHKTSRK